MNNTKRILVPAPTGWGLKEIPGMEKPVAPIRGLYGLYESMYSADKYNFECNLDIYNKALASCHPDVIPFPEGFVPPPTWVEGEAVPVGGYEIVRRKQISFTDRQQWQEMSVSEKDEYYEMIALPAEQQPAPGGKVEGGVWVKASKRMIPDGKRNLERANIKYKGNPDTLVWLNNGWRWDGTDLCPVHNDSWAAIEWLDETTLPDSNYWKERCLAAEEVINEITGSTENFNAAMKEWRSLKQQNFGQ